MHDTHKAKPANRASVDRAYRIVTTFMDAERRQSQEQYLRDFIARRNAENWSFGATRNRIRADG